MNIIGGVLIGFAVSDLAVGHTLHPAIDLILIMVGAVMIAYAFGVLRSKK